MRLLSTRSTNAKAPLWPPSALDVPHRSADADVWEAIGIASAAIGEETFYDRLLEVPAALVESDLLSLVRYSSFGAPDLVTVILVEFVRDRAFVDAKIGYQ